MVSLSKSLSIIVPTFNASDYIEKCLHSLVDQDISTSDYEIIVINDGSTDNTLQILSNLNATISNLIVVEQENLGLSAARNRGINLAAGKYLMFVDSDDYISTMCLGKLLLTAEENKLDILRYNYNSVSIHKNSILPIETFKGQYNCIYSGEEYINLNCNIWAAWLNIYLRDIFLEKQFQFVNDITSEDIELLPRLLISCKRIMAIPDFIYFYMYNDLSITKSRNNDVNRIYKRVKSQFVVLNSNFLLINNGSIDPQTKQHLMNEVIQPTFIAGCAMVFHSPISFTVAKKIQKDYHASVYYPIKVPQSCTFGIKALFRIMNSSTVFNIFYFSGIKFLYFRMRKL